MVSLIFLLLVNSSSTLVHSSIEWDFSSPVYIKSKAKIPSLRRNRTNKRHSVAATEACIISLQESVRDLTYSTWIWSYLSLETPFKTIHYGRRLSFLMRLTWQASPLIHKEKLFNYSSLSILFKGYDYSKRHILVSNADRMPLQGISGDGMPNDAKQNGMHVSYRFLTLCWANGFGQVMEFDLSLQTIQ